MDLQWNKNGNWLLTASRDHLIKVFDIRAMKEIETFKGHKKEATGNWLTLVCHIRKKPLCFESRLLMINNGSLLNLLFHI